MEDSQNSPSPLNRYVCILVPCSFWPTVVCSVMYDEYPRAKKEIDITICLQGGIVLELFQRECVSSIKLSDVSTFNEIQIMRNNQGKLFYLVAADHDVIILSSTEELTVHQRFSSVIYYEVCDPDCSGQAKLMIKTESSTSYVSLDDDVNLPREVHMECTEPVFSVLTKKLIEAKYNLDYHKKSYEQIEKLRQHASFLCQGDDALPLKTSKPNIMFCNKKIVIQLELENPSNESMNKVCVLIHNSTCNSISYTSKIFEHLSTSPFYKELEFREVKSKSKVSMVAVIPISEFKSSISSRIDFNVIVSYEHQKKNYLQSFDDVHISAADVMGKNFDVFNTPEVDERNICLAMLATTVKMRLSLKQKRIEDMISLSTIFGKYLEMVLLGERKTVAIHKHSPYHVLHGILICFDDDYGDIDVDRNETNYNIDVYSRSPSQVLALIHYLYDKVPLALIVTTPNVRVTSHGDSNEDAVDRSLSHNYTQCANSLLNQSSMTLEYLDNCLKEMSKSNNKMDKTNFKIDLFAMGCGEFVKYRNDMLVEAENCFEYLVKSSTQTFNIEEAVELD